MAEFRGGLGTLRQEVKVGKVHSLWHEFGIGQAGGRHHNGLLLDGIGSFDDGTAGALNREAAEMTVALTVVLLASFRLMT